MHNYTPTEIEVITRRAFARDASDAAIALRQVYDQMLELRREVVRLTDLCKPDTSSMTADGVRMVSGKAFAGPYSGLKRGEAYTVTARTVEGTNVHVSCMYAYSDLAELAWEREG